MANLHGSRTTDGRGRVVEATIEALGIAGEVLLKVVYVSHERDRRHLADDPSHSEVSAIEVSAATSWTMVRGGAEYLRDTLDLILDGAVRESEIARLKRELADAEEAHASAHATIQKLLAERLPIPMRLVCEACGKLHVDEGEFVTKPHHTHSCQHCGLTWRPAIVPTVGVRFLPGFKNEPTP